MKFSRRRLLQAGTVLATAAPLAAFASLGTQAQSNGVVLEQVTVAIPRLPREFENYRVGVLTDIHASACVADDVLVESLDLIASEKVDLLLLGGDFIWNTESLIPQASLSITNARDCFVSNADHADRIYSSLAMFIAGAAPPDGVIAVLGNHDRWVNPSICQSIFGASNIRVLVNEYLSITRASSKLVVYGTDDYWTGLPRAPAQFGARNNSSPSECRIVLAHNPDFVADLLDHKIADFDLAVAGHTHGGQIKLPGLGALFYNVRDQRFVEGLQLSAGTPVYTSRGTGTVLMPLRLNCPPEATIIRLVSA